MGRARGGGSFLHELMARKKHGFTQLRNMSEFVLHGDEDVRVVHAYDLEFYRVEGSGNSS